MVKNVLIISMSTLKKNSKKNFYYVKDGEVIESFYSGRYSMEPGTKHILNKLSKDNKKMNKIIMLITPEAKNTNNKPENENAIEYYKEEIKRFVKEGDVYSDLTEVDDFETKLSVEYTSDEVDNLFEEIELSDSNKLSYEAVPEIVEKVLKESENGDYEVRLFLDMQGGSRVSTFIVNAAVHMLQDDKIKLDSTYATLYNQDNKAHQLRDESLSNHVLDMVSGMDEFLNYGRAKKFKEYFAYYKEKYKKGNKLAEEPIVKTICSISDAISICDIEGFYKGVDQLKVEIDKYYDEVPDAKDAIFQAFIQKIEKTYVGIWEKDRRAIDVMKWCLNKEWYQQALTVCEAKIPEQMIKEKVVYYDETFLTKFYNYYLLNKGQLKHVKDSSIFVFKNYLYEFNGKTRAKGSWKDLIEADELLSEYKGDEKLYQVLLQYTKLAGLRNQINHVGQSVKLEKLIDKMKKFIESYDTLVGDNRKTNDYIITMDDIKRYSNERK